MELNQTKPNQRVYGNTGKMASVFFLANDFEVRAQQAPMYTIFFVLLLLLSNTIGPDRFQ